MSHITGTVVTQSPTFKIGPGGGPGTTAVTFSPPASPVQGGTKLLILHFTGVNLPGTSTMEVDLGYGKDVFTAADGPDFWTRPVNVYALPGGVPIRLIATTGAAKAEIDKYGRGERHAGVQDPTAFSNCDPFLGDQTYTEPKYDPFWYCSEPPEWDNVRCVPVGDIRRDVSASVGMIMDVDGANLSTCSVTLIAPDVVITAGHCVTNLLEAARSGSVFFGYQTECDGARPGGYQPIVAKCVEVLAQKWDGTNDYCLMRIAVPAGGLGVPERQMRHDLPGVGEQVFGLHHPNGAVMKLSKPKAAALATVIGTGSGVIQVSSNFDVSGGSSGSALFDLAGRVLGVLSNGQPCAGAPLRYFSTASTLAQVAQPPAPPVSKDVVLVIDRSGSMSLPGDSGRPKIAEARDAASLFVQLVRAGTGSRAGVVSFSTTASVAAALAPVTPAFKTTLVGAAPYSGGVIGAIAAGGATSIGAGLASAQSMLNLADAAPKNILLLTDGLQNTQPWISDVEGSLGSVSVQAIGYGTPGSLDGAVLTALAAAHGGAYVRADSTLRLEKFFAQAFGAIFESGLLQDPEFDLPEDQQTGASMPFSVCGEEAITVVLGWDNERVDLGLTVTTPNGQIVAPGGDVIADSGRMWRFLRIPLTYLGERDGSWTAEVYRPGGRDEIPMGGPATRYFLSVIAAGGPQLSRVPQPVRYYTGDTVNPLVHLGYSAGGAPEDASVIISITGPDRSAGTYLSEQKLAAPRAIDGDTVPSRQATILSGEQAGVSPVNQTAKLTKNLGAAPADTDGAFESAGLFGLQLPDLLTVDGDYTVHAVATFGSGCKARRELLWSLHAEVGIDPSATTIDVTMTGPGVGTVTVTPQDKFGNHVGPGSVGGFTVTAGPGGTVSGSVSDNLDGSYAVPVTWNPQGNFPGLVITQPGRPPVIVGQPAPSPGDGLGCLPWALIIGLLAVVIILTVLLLA